MSCQSGVRTGLRLGESKEYGERGEGRGVTEVSEVWGTLSVGYKCSVFPQVPVGIASDGFV